MPAYPHFLTNKLNFNSIPARINATAMLGAPYDRELTESVEMAREQAKKIVAELVAQNEKATFTNSAGEVIPLEETHMIAMIAYMQRVGTDLFATDVPAGAAPAAVPGALPAETGQLPAAEIPAATPTQKNP